MRKKIRISASDLDNYRYFRKTENKELSELICELRREKPPSHSMRAGTAWHKVMEHAQYGAFEYAKEDGFEFFVKTDIEIEQSLLREVKATKTYLIDDCDVTLVGKVDVINGLEIYDHKFSTKLIYGAKLAERIESLTSGFQWRAYLDIFDAHVFTWFLFSSKEVNENSFEIHEIHKFQACHYPDLRKDLEGELALFIDLCRHHLPEKFL